MVEKRFAVRPIKKRTAIAVRLCENTRQRKTIAVRLTVNARQRPPSTTRPATGPTLSTHRRTPHPGAQDPVAPLAPR
jgi:hypothetical protein